uniref:Uncharacterized protein n=1 Tax=Avena sativa TaxID=4498 RepID=A0ACD5WWC6_AVESA
MEEQMKALSVQHQPLRRGRTPHDELTASVAEIQVLPSQKANDSQSAENAGSELALPEDILFHVHTLMTMRDAARAACVSRVFLNSWRSYPKLTLDTETLGIIKLDTDDDEDKIASDFVTRVDHIMQNHSGNGLKKTINVPMIAGKFNCLKYLELEIMLELSSLPPDFDFHSLVSFLDASHALETFILRVEAPALQHDVVLEYSEAESSRPGCLSGYRHEKLRNMMITGFCSAKSMIELTNHILEKTVSLECLTLDTTRGHDRRLVMIDEMSANE